ncbi:MULTISPECIES: nucleoside deaminase [Lacticaseibacillus]|uniref:Nucleoside deaminase n=2 Tax=Lacticaseibacillus TaxID=2759736 RepID=A0AAN1EYM0_LACCA|nr:MULTISPECIES: nucleoside deaminase [Lacticaseibacillus]ARY91257.1 tRNA-specific adenosine deaminase [Lacticaseibacillus casei]KAB1968427.1 nucleoside deaminase [Lacticaseibacillus casei]WLV81875.1 nucleoside deaminase [Lacticaseibacillus sp. NCIMB 15473]WNX25781.1 nucleoside deaminase [Lacticaseibacillus casei]WNX28554.1 nucleoside deaminase [Lacticaseibacillus casei]
MYQKSFMEIANEEARANVNGSDGGPFGCVIVKDGKIVSRAHNQVLVDHDPTAHGEITAIRKAGQALGTHDLSGCELYTSAMPCPMCLSAIIWANIKQVYYGNTADDAATIGFRDAAIYDFINDGLKGKMLTLSQHDRDMTIGAFKAYQTAQKKLY